MEERPDSRETAESGKRRKSEGEKQIERLLRRCGFEYRCEHPLAVVERGRTRLWYPDFTLPEYGVIIEYAGFNGEQYEAGLRHKESVYEELGVPAVFVYSRSFRGYWPARLLRQIEDIEKRRFEKLTRILGNFKKE